ncbi:MAG: RluA family pseudouridine synthase, partial [Campylobacteraceae bacterium]|nr:RluA family pseudouridine synthase [Campylobacteraceae bacterium]
MSDEILFQKIVCNDAQRLDSFLARFLGEVLPGASRSGIATAIKAGLVSVNKKAVLKPSHKLKINDEVLVKKSRIPSENSRIPNKNSRIPSENSRISNELFEKIKIIYEDDDILVISKPSGLVVHEASSLKGESTLVDFLKQSNRQLATLGGEFRAGIVHRLDRHTSGVMVVAKSDFASAELSSQLQQKTASRIYIALCDLPLKQNCVVERAI